MQITTLANVPHEVLRSTFEEAFSDYELPIRLSNEAFQEMMRTRDLSFEHSVGAFNGKRLVGFILCGYRRGHGGAALYDGGTGVVSDYRGNHIASAMLERILEQARQQKIDRFLLEVLEHNSAAQELYRKAGFSIQRFFRCYRIDKQCLQKTTPDSNCHFVPLDRGGYENLDHQSLLSFSPSWQNDIQSVLNNWNQYGGLKVVRESRVIGYGIIHRIKGDLPQVGVEEGPTSQKNYNVLIYALSRLSESATLSALNIEDGTVLNRIFESNDWENHVNQYEMLYEIH